MPFLRGVSRATRKDRNRRRHCNTVLGSIEKTAVPFAETASDLQIHDHGNDGESNGLPKVWRRPSLNWAGWSNAHKTTCGEFILRTLTLTARRKKKPAGSSLTVAQSVKERARRSVREISDMPEQRQRKSAKDQPPIRHR
jgi:hypothetical protein